MSRYLTYAGGVDGSGCLARMFFYDVPTRSWRVQGPEFGTAQGQVAGKANAQHLWVNFWERKSGKSH
jgi:hypothetical protein